MRLICQTRVHLLGAVVIAGLLCCAGGCRTGGPTMPKFGDLAWWKKDGSAIARTDTPVSPARHFDPEPSGVADASNEQVRENLKQILAQAEREKNAVGNQPIRTPYSSNSNSRTPATTTYELTESVNFDPLTGKLKTKLPDFESGVEDLKDVAQTAENSLSARKLAEAIEGQTQAKGLAGQFAAAADRANESVTQTVDKAVWRGDIQLPKSEFGGDFAKTIASARESLNRGAAQVNPQAIAARSGGAFGIGNSPGGTPGRGVAEAVSGASRSLGQARAKAVEAGNAIGSTIQNGINPAASGAGDVVLSTTGSDAGLEAKMDQMQQTIAQLQSQLAAQNQSTSTAIQAPQRMPVASRAQQSDGFERGSSTANTQQAADTPATTVSSNNTFGGAPERPVQPAGSLGHVSTANESPASAQQRLAQLQPNSRLAGSRYQSTGVPEYRNNSIAGPANRSLIDSNPAASPGGSSSPQPPQNGLRGGSFGPGLSYPATRADSYGSNNAPANAAGFDQGVGGVRTVSGTESSTPPFGASPYAPGSVRHSIPHE